MRHTKRKTNYFVLKIVCQTQIDRMRMAHNNSNSGDNEKQNGQIKIGKACATTENGLYFHFFFLLILLTTENDNCCRFLEIDVCKMNGRNGIVSKIVAVSNR